MTTSHRYFTINIDLIAIRCYAVKECICDTTAAEPLMPAFDRHLRAENSRGLVLVSRSEQDQQVTLLFLSRRQQEKVIEDYQWYPAEAIDRSS